MTEEQKQVTQEAIRKLKWDMATIRYSCPWPKTREQLVKQRMLECLALEQKLHAT